MVIFHSYVRLPEGIPSPGLLAQASIYRNAEKSLADPLRLSTWLAGKLFFYLYSFMCVFFAFKPPFIGKIHYQ